MNMHDREKVIRGLEVCSTVEDLAPCPNECPYHKPDAVCYGTARLMQDALALLREQEPVKPEHFRSTIRSFGSDGFRDECSVDLYKCGICHKAIEDTHSFCPYCGRRVKWDG